MLYDAATGYLDAYPMVNKDEESVGAAMSDFVGNQEVSHFYSDGGRELIKAAKSLAWRCDTSTPHRPKSNGVAEEKVKRVLYTSRAILENAGLELLYWPFAVKAACVGSNISGGKNSPYYKRHQALFMGKKFPLVQLLIIYRFQVMLRKLLLNLHLDPRLVSF